jgi:2'-5' RNA ligase
MEEKAIVIFFQGNKKIEAIRKKYDPFYKEVKTHLTLVYPFNNINPKKLKKHIISSLSTKKSFKVVLNGFQNSSKDYYLYLLVKKGKSKIINLYHKLNSGVLRGFENKDMKKFIPHVTLGIFKDKKDISRARKELRNIKIATDFTIDKISLLTFKKGRKIKARKDFKLDKKI